MRQLKKSILIKLTNEGVYLNDDLLIRSSQTNIPCDHMKFRSSTPVYWRVEMQHYHTEQHNLEVQVVDYEPYDVSGFTTQVPTNPISFITFGKLDWRQLQPQLTSYQKIKLSAILLPDSDPGKPLKDYNRQLPTHIEFDSTSADYIENTEPRVEENLEWKESFWIPFSECMIGLGFVSFEKYLSRFDRVIHFKVYNDHLLPEFNVIRFWFAKKLKTKRFYVQARVIAVGQEIIDTHATSEQVDKIGPGLIDSIKYQRVSELRKEPKTMSPDKSLFTADEMFGLFDTEDAQGNVFRQSEEDILAMLLEKSDIRNKKQLAYLAGNKQSGAGKLRFTLYPHFGFLFFIEGEESNHFVWELLNSHATYVWSFDKKDKSFELCFKHIERTINLIRSSGREAYKRAYHDRSVDQDIVFCAIPHEDIDSKLVDGFPRWKVRLNEQLV